MLIFVSVAERYAEILADAGINAKVTPQVWDKAVAALIAGIADGPPRRRLRRRHRAMRRRAGRAFSARRDQPRRAPDKLVEI